MRTCGATGPGATGRADPDRSGPGSAGDPALPAWMKIAAALAVLLIGSLLAWNIALRNDNSGDQGTVVGQLAPAPDARISPRAAR